MKTHDLPNLADPTVQAILRGTYYTLLKASLDRPDLGIFDAASTQVSKLLTEESRTEVTRTIRGLLARDNAKRPRPVAAGRGQHK